MPDGEGLPLWLYVHEKLKNCKKRVAEVGNSCHYKGGEFKRFTPLKNTHAIKQALNSMYQEPWKFLIYNSYKIIR